ncbi:MAG: hypothetical protein WDA60_08120 [Acidimicrobiia bacterium]|jgi:hypothetical protein
MPTPAPPDVAASLEAELRARVGSTRVAAPASLVGLEHEFTVRTATEWPVDFRDLLPGLDLRGGALDPGDPHARRTRSGVVVSADGSEAEVAVPPIAVEPGFGDTVARWSRAARRELTTRLPADYALTGYSTHLSVAVGDARNKRLGALYARTFAPGLMLLVDRATSPGLIVRPRPGRTELCGEFVDGPWLRAAATYAVGSVLACHEALRGDRPLAALPPQLAVTLRPATTRAGWFVDRGAFGSDLLSAGRAARLRRCDGRAIRAQDHLERAWDTARSALGAHAHGTDVGLVDAMVGGSFPLPRDASAEEVDAGDTGPLPGPSPLGDVVRARVRPDFVADAVTATWDVTVFCLRARRRSRTAYASIPRASLGSFLRALDHGELDDLIDRYLAVDPADRPLATTGAAPSLGDLPPSTAEVTDADAVRDLDDFLGYERAGAGKWAPLVTVLPAAFVVEPPPEPEPEHRRVPTAAKWVAGFTALALSVGAVYVATRGGSSGGTGAAKTATGPGSVRCGTDLGGPRITIDAVVRRCDYSASQRVGTAYEFDATPWEQATVTAETQTAQPVVGATCKVHDANAAELAAARDPLTGFLGLSFLGVPIADLDPNGLVQIGARAPDGALRTGRGVADKTGYAEVHIPINVPAGHTVESATYYPTGNMNGPAVSIPTTSIGSNGVIDGSFPGNRCDRGATLDRVPSAPGSSGSTADARVAASRAAGLFWLFGALAHPGSDFSVAGPYAVMPSGNRFTVDGNGLRVDLRAVTPSAPAKGVAATAPSYHGGALVGPGADGTAASWAKAFPCGPGQLAYTVCADPETSLSDGPFAAVYSVFRQPVPIAGSGDVVYTFDLGEQRYTLTHDAARGPGREWSLTNGDPRARVMIRDNVVMLLAPKPSTESYRITVGSGATRRMQPAEPAPPAGLTSVVTVAPLSGAETPEAFLAALGTALTNGDTAFLGARLHPAVIQRYGATACDGFAAGHHTPVQFTVNEVRAPSAYAWTTDGRTTTVPNTTEVVVTAASGGTAGPQTVHVALVDGTWRYFADCTP